MRPAGEILLSATQAVACAAVQFVTPRHASFNCERRHSTVAFKEAIWESLGSTLKVYYKCDSSSIRARQKGTLLIFIATNCVNGVVATQRGVGDAFE
jgi:hypothetical protein